MGDTLARLTALEAKEDYDSPEYQKILEASLAERQGSIVKLERQ